MSSLEMKGTRDGATLTVALAGQIDEDADYDQLQVGDAARVVFDFEGVKLINSTGLQRWIKFLAGLPPAVGVAFARCSIRVITQINMFPGFMAGRPVVIESFFAPYFCEACDASRELLVERARHAQDLAEARAPAMACPKCGGKTEFDGIEKKYLMFLKG